MDEGKYNFLFINSFGVNRDQLYSEYKRIINEHGNSEEIKIAFYSQAFENVMTQFENEMEKNETSFSTITFCYNSFIRHLDDDGIDSSNQKMQLERFQRKYNDYKGHDKKHNLNTKYGRQKWREQKQKEYYSLSSEEKLNRNIIGILILIGLSIIVYLMLGRDGFLKWATR
jgi:ATP-dependent Clp protease ATP-binding subunit ClpA